VGCRATERKHFGEYIARFSLKLRSKTGHDGNLDPHALGKMAKPNYQFEKRQRDLAKKSKQEEKRRQKLADKAAGGDTPAEADDDATDAAPASERTPDA
jgi:hypothetical protein